MGRQHYRFLDPGCDPGRRHAGRRAVARIYFNFTPAGGKFTSARQAARLSRPSSKSSEGFHMLAVMSAMAANVGESSFGQWCGKAGAVVDCVIPIALTIAQAVGSGAIIFGLLD
jgi:hypothetical protein